MAGAGATPVPRGSLGGPAPRLGPSCRCAGSWGSRPSTACIACPASPGERDAAVLPVVNAYAGGHRRRARRAALGLRGGVPAARRARLRPRPRGRRRQPAHRRGPGPGERHPDQRRPAVRRPRPPGVLLARRCTNPPDAVLWDKAGERVMAEAARPGRRPLPGSAPIQLYKNNTDNKGASYGCARELPDAPRSTPFADIVKPPRPVLRVPPGRMRRRPGRHRRRRPRRRLPDQPAGRLLRGRGRPGDHPEAAHHQHPGRAARRPGAVPAAARDHRRRQPVARCPPTSRSAPPRWCSR